MNLHEMEQVFEEAHRLFWNAIEYSDVDRARKNLEIMRALITCDIDHFAIAIAEAVLIDMQHAD